jgi:hypothetical protein
MRIDFVTSRGTGHIDLPEDTTSVKLPKGICKNCDEDIEILTHSVFTNEQDVMATTTDIVDDPTQGVEKHNDADLEKLIPNLNL